MLPVLRITAAKRQKRPKPRRLSRYRSVQSHSDMKHYEDIHCKEHDDSALKVNEGVVQPPIVNPYFQRRKRHTLSTDDYIKGIREGNITILAQAITLVESLLPEHYAQAQEIIERCLPYSGNSVRIGITGVPGAGKSTFIEAVGEIVASLGHKLSVLAIDPSSERSGGSILGDKTRMEQLVHNPSVGGVARKTRESIILCEAAGFDVIFIETVGVGQSETAVHSMVDLFLLIQIAGAGDELQGIKRGIMEMADMIAINKCDSGNQQRAELAKRHFLNALNLFPMPDSGWRPRVYTCSATEGNGLSDIWNGIEDFLKFTKQNGYYQRNRHRQAKYWMYETINEALRENFYRNPQVEAHLKENEELVLSDKKSSFIAARDLLNDYFDSLKK